MTWKDKEKPLPTVSERLAKAQDALGELSHQYPVECLEDDNSGEPAVYVNYDFSTAVVIGWDDDFQMYRLEAFHWDETHGVDDQHEIGLLADPDIAAHAAVQFAKARERM